MVMYIFLMLSILNIACKSIVSDKLSSSERVEENKRNVEIISQRDNLLSQNRELRLEKKEWSTDIKRLKGEIDILEKRNKSLEGDFERSKAEFERALEELKENEKGKERERRLRRDFESTKPKIVVIVDEIEDEKYSVKKYFNSEREKNQDACSVEENVDIKDLREIVLENIAKEHKIKYNFNINLQDFTGIPLVEEKDIVKIALSDKLSKLGGKSFWERIIEYDEDRALEYISKFNVDDSNLLIKSINYLGRVEDREKHLKIILKLIEKQSSFGVIGDRNDSELMVLTTLSVRFPVMVPILKEIAEKILDRDIEQAYRINRDKGTLLHKIIHSNSEWLYRILDEKKVDIEKIYLDSKKDRGQNISIIDMLESRVDSEDRKEFFEELLDKLSAIEEK